MGTPAPVGIAPSLAEVGQSIVALQMRVQLCCLYCSATHIALLGSATQISYYPPSLNPLLSVCFAWRTCPAGQKHARQFPQGYTIC
jgi:hypothetical protein